MTVGSAMPHERGMTTEPRNRTETADLRTYMESRQRVRECALGLTPPAPHYGRAVRWAVGCQGGWAESVTSILVLGPVRVYRESLAEALRRMGGLSVVAVV